MTTFKNLIFRVDLFGSVAGVISASCFGSPQLNGGNTVDEAFEHKIIHSINLMDLLCFEKAVLFQVRVCDCPYPYLGPVKGISMCLASVMLE